MSKHNSALLVLIAVAVVVSGCTTGGGGTGGTKGVVITYFEPDISEIYSGDEVMFTAGVENVGGEDAENVKLLLFGLGNTWKYSSNNPKGTKQDITGTLEKSESSEGIRGGTGEAQWEVGSPNSLKVDNVYTANVRLSYSYITTALANVKIYDNEYLQSIPEQTESIMASSGIDTFTVTDAPITIELSGFTKPLVYRADSTTKEASVRMLISNIGEGKPFLLDDESTPKIEVVRVKVNDELITLDEDTYRLPRSGKKSVAFNFPLPEIESYTTIPIEIVLSYKYFIDDSTQITVLKSLFLDENGGSPTSSTSSTLAPGEFECVEDADCCSNVGPGLGPCSAGEGRFCDGVKACHCGAGFEDYGKCPPSGAGG